MASQFARSVLRVAVAQICQNIGWHSVQSSPLDLLVDILHRYTLELSKTAHKYCNQYGRTEPNLDDLALAFKELGIIVQEVEEYVNNVEPVAFAHAVSSFPIAHPSNIHPKPGNLEMLHRVEWMHDNHLVLHPELEDDEGMITSPSSTSDAGNKKLGLEGILGTGGESPPLGSPHTSGKRPLDSPLESLGKKPRLYTEEEGRPMREMTTVSMTSSGVINQNCAGKLPEASAPLKIDSPLYDFESRIENIDTIEPRTIKKDFKLKDIRIFKKDKEKNKKSKAFSSKKESRRVKLKQSKKEKENKGNVILKTEKIVDNSVEINEIRKITSEDTNQKKKLLKCEKNGDDKPLKVKNDKLKQKEEKKNKESTKSSKTKNKLKGSLSKFISTPKSPKSPKVPKSPLRAKSPIASKTSKPNKSPLSSPIKPPINAPVKEELIIPQPSPLLSKVDIDEKEKFVTAFDDLDDESREESPEPRLVIDDSAEAQARQEKECRMAVLDECIDAVIQRAMVESEKNAKENDRALNETIDEVVRNSVIKKTEPRDIYDFTDSSNSSPAMSPKNLEIGSPIMRNKKEKVKTPDSANIVTSNNEIQKKGKTREKTKKKPLSKSKISPSLSSPKANKIPTPVPTPSPTEKKVPTPITPEKKEIHEIDEEPIFTPIGIIKPSQPPQCQLPPPSLSPFSSSPFIPASPHTGNPFSAYPNPFAQFPSRVAFPTPPLFVSHRSDIPTSFFPAPPSPQQPLNLAMSGPNVPAKNPVDKKAGQTGKSTKITDESEELNPSKKIKLEDEMEKTKEKKEPKKERKEKEKTDKKEKSKKKVKEKAKPKEKVEKAKSERKSKVKPEKEKDKKKTKEKEKEEKQMKDDSSIPRITFKLGGNSSASGSTKIIIKSTSKSGTATPPSSPASSEVEIPSEQPPEQSSSSLPQEPSPSPQPEPSTSQTPPPLSALVAPGTKGHPKPVTKGKVSQPITNKKVPSSSSSPARTVIIETLGTFVDESGNKIWICPACKQPDDGSPMIGCDECDDWYHWVCVGIVVPPKEEESWYCTRCIAKRQGSNPRRKKKKHKKEK